MTVSRMRWRTAACAAGVGLALVFVSPGFARADDDFARLLQLSPDTTAQELEDSARAYAQSAGITYAEALALARAGAEANLIESSGGSCDTPEKIIGNAELRGDVFYSSSTHGIDHGHVGLYSQIDQITEAPGVGKRSGTFSATGRTYCTGIEKMHVDTSSAYRGKAADFAETKLVGKSYGGFLFNKDDSLDDLNCSELVWKAYMFGPEVDLDAGEPTAVYPLDIKNSKLTDTYKTIT
ncbi:MAG: hypothetical protein HOQ24_05910 [Mycobacteriaceae bacterium]|nr:hypothetical protein [Mycobacteriaceae bacterium]